MTKVVARPTGPGENKEQQGKSSEFSNSFNNFLNTLTTLSVIIDVIAITADLIHVITNGIFMEALNIFAFIITVLLFAIMILVLARTLIGFLLGICKHFFPAERPRREEPNADALQQVAAARDAVNALLDWSSWFLPSDWREEARILARDNLNELTDNACDVATVRRAGLLIAWHMIVVAWWIRTGTPPPETELRAPFPLVLLSAFSALGTGVTIVTAIPLALTGHMAPLVAITVVLGLVLSTMLGTIAAISAGKRRLP